MPSKKEKIGFRIEDHDDVIRDWLEPFRKANLLSDIMRLLVYERTGEPLPDDLEFLAFKIGPSRIERMQEDIEVLQFQQETVIQEMRVIRDEIQTLVENGSDQVALNRLEDKFDQLAQTVEQLSRKVSNIQSREISGAVEDDDVTTPIGEDQARQDAASAKLRGMNFRKLH